MLNSSLAGDLECCHNEVSFDHSILGIMWWLSLEIMTSTLWWVGI